MRSAVTDLDPGLPTDPRPPRRRRSAARTPALVDPADVPEDAAGRVELIAIRAPADVLDSGDAAPAPPAGPTGWLMPLVLLSNGWVAVGVLMALLVVVFVIGVVFTR